MTRTNKFLLAGVFAGVACLSWLFLSAWTTKGIALVPTPWTIPAFFVVTAAVLLGFGWTVRQYLRGDKPGLSGIRAARTAAFAKAASFVGSAFGGWYVGTVLVIVTAHLSEYRKEQAILAAIAALAAIGLCVVGYIVEGFCQLPPQDKNHTAKEDF